jgi:tetratricopeptide (TPR) repeat protein
MRLFPRRTKRAAAIGCHAHGFAWTCLALSCCGCHLIGGQQPVSKQEAASRQLSQRGISLVEQGDWKKGEEDLAAAIKTFPGDPEAHRHYAEVLWHKGDRTAALAEMMQAVRLNGDDPQLLARTGEITLELGHIDDADKLAGEALALNPRLSSGWTLRGEVAELRGQMQTSLADLDRALELQHDDKRTLFLIAELYRQQGRADRALGTLEILRDCYPPGEEPQQLLVLEGLAFSALRRFDDAADVYTLALAREPQSIELCDRLAEAQLLGGRSRDAAVTIDQALALDPNHLPTRALAERIEVAVRPGDTRRE